jgi:hypothetical protein
MAIEITQLKDMIVPEEWNSYIELTTTQKSELFTSGIVQDLSAEVGNQLEGPLVHMPYFDDLDSDDDHEEQQLDDEDDIVVDGITTGMDVAVKTARAKSFGSTDLAADLSGADPIAAIQNKFAGWWARRYQTALLSVLEGAMGSVGMESNVLDISGLTGDAAKFAPVPFVEAAFLLGDAAGGLTALAVHSQTLKSMVLADMITVVKDSTTNLDIPTYMGKRIIVDDSMPVTGTGVDRVYTSYLFGPGAIGYATKPLKVPVEVGRNALKTMGQDYVVNRKQWVLHPRGIAWKGNAVKKSGPVNAELKNPANWNRVYDHKLIRLVAFKHKN